MQTILVTGASGFVGGHVVQALLELGLHVRCLVRHTSRLDFLKPLAPELILGDVTEPETLERAAEGIDAAVHCAGLTKTPSSGGYFRVNEEGARNLYTACRKRCPMISRIVHLSSLSALGPSIGGIPVTEDSVPHPVSEYGRSKLAGQRIAESFMPELPVSILIPPAVYGPQDADFLVYFKWVARGILPLIGRTERHISLIYAEDLAEAVARALFDDRAVGKSYLVDDGTVHTWTSVANTISHAMARAIRPIHLPLAVARCIGKLGDVYSKLTGKACLINTEKVRELLQPSWTCSSQKLRAEMDFQPKHNLEEGIRKTLAWYRQNGWL